MPVVYRTVHKQSADYHICDICKAEDHNNLGWFVLQHWFGFGTANDGKYVEAVICDNCLAKIVEEIPTAKWE